MAAQRDPLLGPTRAVAAGEISRERAAESRAPVEERESKRARDERRALEHHEEEMRVFDRAVELWDTIAKGGPEDSDEEDNAPQRCARCGGA